MRRRPGAWLPSAAVGTVAFMGEHGESQRAPFSQGPVPVTVDDLQRRAAAVPSDVDVAALTFELQPHASAPSGATTVRSDLGERARAALAAALPAGTPVACGTPSTFAVLLEGVNERRARATAHRLLRLLREPGGEDATGALPNVFLGLAMRSRDVGGGDVFEDADAGRDEAWRLGGNRVVVADRAVRERMRRRREAVADLRQALAEGALVVDFDPIGDLASGRIHGVSASPSWPARPDLGTAALVELAHATNVLAELDEWVLREACAHLGRLERARPEQPISVALGIGVSQLLDPGFVERMRSLLRDTGAPPERLCLELREDRNGFDPTDNAALRRTIRALGVRVIVAAFGQGFTQIGMIKDFPLCYSKVTTPVIHGLGTGDGSDALFRLSLQIADVLGIDLVALGVDDERLRDRVLALGGRFAQGAVVRDLARERRPATRREPAFERNPDAPDPAGAVAEPDQSPAAPPAHSYLPEIAHELQSPLTVILGVVDLMTDPSVAADPTTVREAADRLAHAAWTVQALVRELTDVDALDRRSVRLSRHRFDLGELAARAAALSETALPGRVFTVEDEGDVVVDADLVRIGQILTNLLRNAADHGPADAPVEVRVSTRDGAAIVDVIDRGPGVPVAFVDGLFRRFGRIGAQGRGRGLGLYISRSLARYHGGDVTYRGADGGGAHFSLTLPLSASADRAARDARPERARREGESDRRGRPITPAPAVGAVDRASLLATAHATRALVTATTPEEVVGVGIDLVRRLGGRVMPVHVPSSSVLPFDLSLGQDGELRVLAEPLSVARARLDAVLPDFVADARLVVSRLRQLPARPGHTDPETGLPWPSEFRESLDSATKGEMLAVVTLGSRLAVTGDRGYGSSAHPLRALARALRNVLRTGDAAARWSSVELAVLLRTTSPDEALDTIDELRVAWLAHRPYVLPFLAGLAVFDGESTATTVAAAVAAARIAEGHGDPVGAVELARPLDVASTRPRSETE